MTLRFQRLFLILFSLIFLLIAVLLILFNSKKNLVFFYTPSELLESNSEINDLIRIGGFVKKNSLINLNNNKYNFLVTDQNNSVKVIFEGILPDLFREGQGTVVEGILIEKNLLKAKTVFAKHDENYVPKSIKNQLEKKQFWKNNYK
tara:strand:- start:485 stop:925 length:441 start_codon:yes stop_codon:yes gene_type:complete